MIAGQLLDECSTEMEQPRGEGAFVVGAEGDALFLEKLAAIGSESQNGCGSLGPWLSRPPGGRGGGFAGAAEPLWLGEPGVAAEPADRLARFGHVVILLPHGSPQAARPEVFRGAEDELVEIRTFEKRQLPVLWVGNTLFSEPQSGARRRRGVLTKNVPNHLPKSVLGKASS